MYCLLALNMICFCLGSTFTRAIFKHALKKTNLQIIYKKEYTIMSVITVTTIEELKNAKENGASDIYVKGKLAHDLIQVRKIALLSPVAIATLTAAIAGIAAAPATGGISAIGSALIATPVIAGTGLSASTITFLATLVIGGLSISIIVSLFLEYKVDIDFKEQTIHFHK